MHPRKALAVTTQALWDPGSGASAGQPLGPTAESCLPSQFGGRPGPSPFHRGRGVDEGPGRDTTTPGPKSRSPHLPRGATDGGSTDLVGQDVYTRRVPGTLPPPKHGSRRRLPRGPERRGGPTGPRRSTVDGGGQVAHTRDEGAPPPPRPLTSLGVASMEMGPDSGACLWGRGWTNVAGRGQARGHTRTPHGVPAGATLDPTGTRGGGAAGGR